MKKQLIPTMIATTLLASAIAPTVQASEADAAQVHYIVAEQEQLIGLGSGAALGALVGGPAGAMIGAIVGGIVGTTVGQEEYIKSQDEELMELSARNTELERVSQKFNQAQTEIAHLQQDLQVQRDEPRELDLALETNVHFRTGSDLIEPHFQQQLDELAGLMKQAPKVKWLLSGYADRRGDSQKNLALSMRRVDAVSEYLETRGVDRRQFDVEAYGDLEPVKSEQNFESDFFDRRVTLRSEQPDMRTAHMQ
ncbi:sortase-associated OmpA-like protein PdsO [Photobacterium lipolyticum]|uniref:Cell envelope biogenesis protein OmpA n=1 Tax=Photobacterium lipolyticum TaxID=266810 RepID=A0A2T3MRY4_9GAMM|nr:sortase-associated OmpA-like protein PdsO [Photobacterium lipolyticum]PSW00131.1 cell envelope biogenesis protein OmpA [Photobacterium lipolyticum]